MAYRTSNFLHILWRIPSAPSRAEDPEIQTQVFRWLTDLQKTPYRVLDFFCENSNLEALLEARDMPATERQIEAVNQRLREILKTQPSKAPLHFQTDDLKALRAAGKRHRPDCAKSLLNPPNTSYKIEPKRRGNFSQFVIRSGNQIHWPTKKVVSIW